MLCAALLMQQYDYATVPLRGSAGVHRGANPREERERENTRIPSGQSIAHRLNVSAFFAQSRRPGAVEIYRMPVKNGIGVH